MTLIHYWPSTETSGTTLTDIVGGNTATISGGTMDTIEGPAFHQMTPVTEYDFALHFDLASDVVLDDGADWTIDWWHQKQITNRGHLFGSTTTLGRIVCISDTEIRVYNDAETLLTFTFAQSIGTRWVHPQLSYNATTGMLSAFLDGVEATNSPLAYAGTLTIDALGRDVSFEFDGGLGFVRVWDSDETANAIKNWVGDYPLEVFRSMRYRGVPAQFGGYVHSITANQYATNAGFLADVEAAATNPNLRLLVLDIEPGQVNIAYTPYQWWVDDGGSIETWATYDETERNQLCQFFADYIAERLYYLKNTILPSIPALAGIPVGVYLESNHWAFSSTALAAIEQATTQGHATGLTGTTDPPDLDEFPGILQQIDFIAVPSYRESAISFAYYTSGFMDYSYDPFRRLWDGDMLGWVNCRFHEGANLGQFMDQDQFVYTLRAMQAKGVQYLCMDDFSHVYNSHVEGYWAEESGHEAIDAAVRTYRGEREYEAYRIDFSGGASTDAESTVHVHEQRANTYGPVPMEIDTYDDGLTNATYQYRTMSDGAWTVRCENLTGTDPTIGLEATYLMETRQKYRLKIRWRNRDAYGVNYLRYYDGAAWHAIEVGAHRGWVNQTVEFKAKGETFRLGITSQETGSYLLAEFDEVTLTAIPPTTVAILVNAV